MWWADTANNRMKIRNASDSGWIDAMPLTLVVSSFAASLLDDATAAEMRETLGAAQDANLVHRTGDETKDGVLTLTSSPIVPSPTNATHAANKGYIDAATALRGHLAGLTLSTAGSSATMTIAEGQAADSTNAALINLAASISKTTSSWAVGSGNGGLDTGTIANNTWYHFYAIRRPDTGVVDVCFSTSASSPTLPTNYTQYRRIGSGKTNGSAQWTKFVQDGDLFQWDAAVLDVDVTSPGTSAVSRTLSVPTGVNVMALFNYAAYDPTNANQIGAYFSDLAVSDQAPIATAAPLASGVSQGASAIGGLNRLDVRTNTSAQIRSRMTTSSGTSVLRIATLGWIDKRGKDA
jgi:hypothetical protein